jgi:hypothetical protein
MDWAIPAALSVFLTLITTSVLAVQLRILGRGTYAQVTSASRPAGVVPLGRWRIPAMLFGALVLVCSLGVPFGVLARPPACPCRLQASSCQRPRSSNSVWTAASGMTVPWSWPCHRMAQATPHRSQVSAMFRSDAPFRGRSPASAWWFLPAALPGCTRRDRPVSVIWCCSSPGHQGTGAWPDLAILGGGSPWFGRGPQPTFRGVTFPVRPAWWQRGSWFSCCAYGSWQL